jgi:stage III sporulation protein SpoIIIAA
MSVDNILQEASAVLHAALRYSSKFSETDKIDHHIYRMRVLITQVAAHSYTTLGNNTNVSAELRELQDIKDLVLRTAEKRFGSTSMLISEFHNARKQTLSS